MVMTGTTSGRQAADETVSRAGSLADAVLSWEFCDVFGDRHVVGRGEGLMAGKSELEHSNESVPGVVLLGKSEERDAFRVDTQYLEGLLGFEKGQIQRPGLAIHLFEENEAVHGQYNREIQLMLQSGLAAWPSDKPVERPRIEAVGEVTVLPFKSKFSEAVHDSLRILREGAPLDKTVLFTVDEFCVPVWSHNRPRPRIEKTMGPDQRRQPRLAESYL